MTEKQECIGCGAEPTDEVHILACAACAPLVQAAVTSLRPTTWGEGADALSPARRAALIKARWVARQMALAVDLLAREDLPDDAVAVAITQVDELHAKVHGHTATRVAAMRLVDTLEVAALGFKKGLTIESALGKLARDFAALWPDCAKRVDVQKAKRAIVAWAENLDDKLRPSKRGKWKEVHELLVAAGLWNELRGDLDKRTPPWEVLRVEWSSWRATGGRATQASADELRSRLLAAP